MENACRPNVHALLSTLLVYSSCRPTYSAISHMMTFQYVVLAMNSTQLPAVGGTVNDYVMRARDADSKTHNSTLSAVMPGTTFYAARWVTSSLTWEFGSSHAFMSDCQGCVIMPIGVLILAHMHMQSVVVHATVYCATGS